MKDPVLAHVMRYTREGWPPNSESMPPDEDGLMTTPSRISVVWNRLCLLQTIACFTAAAW